MRKRASARYSHQRSSTRRQPVVAVRGGDLVSGGNGVGVGVAHGHPGPAQRSISTSLGMSPNATTSSALISSGRATSLDADSLADSDQADFNEPVVGGR